MKRLLLMYHGGGYDGCIWEWNFAYFTAGTFTDIYSSGIMGCKTLKDFQARIKDNYCTYYIYDIDNDIEMKDFTDNTNAGLVIAVGKWIKENLNFEVTAECNFCNAKFPISELTPECIKGAGGIMMQFTKVVCDDCRINYTCNSCGEFYENLKYANFNEDGICEYCQEQQKKDRIKELKENLQKPIFGNVNHIEMLKELNFLTGY